MSDKSPIESARQTAAEARRIRRDAARTLHERQRISEKWNIALAESLSLRAEIDATWPERTAAIDRFVEGRLRTGK